jgi:hypothetical protein
MNRLSSFFRKVESSLIPLLSGIGQLYTTVCRRLAHLELEDFGRNVIAASHFRLGFNIIVIVCVHVGQIHLWDIE